MRLDGTTVGFKGLIRNNLRHNLFAPHNPCDLGEYARKLRLRRLGKRLRDAPLDSQEENIAA